MKNRVLTLFAAVFVLASCATQPSTTCKDVGSTRLRSPASTSRAARKYW